jgi:hypothetical protein
MYTEEYWKQAMKNRQPLWNEVDRLIMIAKGYYLDEIKYEIECNDEITKFDFNDYDLLYFVKNAKRPYGNKNIEASICYNLGWDCKRDLENWRMPDWVIKEAEKVQEAVIKQLEEDNNQ